MGDNLPAAPFGYHELVLNDKAIIAATVIAQPVHPDSKLLIAYWKECADRGGLKLGRDLPAAPVRKLMSKLIVFEPVSQNADFRIRLAGTGLLRRFGRDISGELLSAVYSGPSFDNYLANLLVTLTTGTPLLLDILITEGPNQLFHIEYVFLPVLAYDGDKNWVVTGAFYLD